VAVERSARAQAGSSEPAAPDEQPIAQEKIELAASESSREDAFATFWEFAVAVNRSDPKALALASNGATSEFAVDGAEVKKLLGMMWFRTVLTRLSEDWRERLLSVLVEYAPVPDHAVRLGRHTTHLRQLTHAQLQEIGSRTLVPDAVRPDLDLLITVGRFWGPEALKRFRFVEASEPPRQFKVEGLIDRFLQ
jgi:hypothetical protein